MPPHQSMAGRSGLVCGCGDFGGFAPGAVVAPEIVIVERLSMCASTGMTLEPVVSSAMAAI